VDPALVAVVEHEKVAADLDQIREEIDEGVPAHR